MWRLADPIATSKRKPSLRKRGLRFVEILGATQVAANLSRGELIGGVVECEG